MNIPIQPDPEKDQIFVRLYLQTGDVLDSFIRSGHEPHGYEKRTAAEYLLERADIQLALKTAETLKPKAPVDITRESIVSDYENVYSEAFRDKDYTAAIAAKKNQAAILGLISENVQVTHRMDVTQMSDEQIMKILTARSKHIDGEFTIAAPVGLGQLSGSK